MIFVNHESECKRMEMMEWDDCDWLIVEVSRTKKVSRTNERLSVILFDIFNRKVAVYRWNADSTWRYVTK